MNFTMDTSALDAQAERFAAMPVKVAGALRASMQAAMQQVVQSVQDDKLSGQVLHVRSGRLRSSITAHVDASGDIISGVVGSDLPYAAIHEYGGTILRDRLRASVIVEPERSYLRTSPAEQADAIQSRLTQAVMDAVET